MRWPDPTCALSNISRADRPAALLSPAASGTRSPPHRPSRIAHLAKRVGSSQKPAPIAMFIVPPSTGDACEQALADMIETQPEITPWIWRFADGEIPRLP